MCFGGKTSDKASLQQGRAGETGGTSPDPLGTGPPGPQKFHLLGGRDRGAPDVFKMGPF